MRSARWLLLWAWAGALGCSSPDDAAVDAGADAAATCDRNTCTAGCCTADGRCIRDTDDNICGIDGRACAPCEAGETCIGGVCTILFDTAEDCRPETCRGCCVDRRCAATPSDTYCGLPGGQCTLCLSWQECRNGVCELDENRCGPHNCDGCCRSGYVCERNTDVHACAVGGMYCEDCIESGYLECVDGVCVR
ncbi:MAG: hypothetical protein KC620_21650 [Myxococcales bacterium]|nr:hypothetical protein [Myxococcales bacterium]